MSEINQQNQQDIILDITSSEAIKSSGPQRDYSIMGLFNGVNDWLINSSSVALQDKLIFFQLLGSMIGAGLPILDALKLLVKQTSNPKMKRVIGDMKKMIEEGESLAESMRLNDDVFDEATCSVVEAGEKSGKLNDILKELVSQYEQLSEITAKIKSIMMYPLIVSCVILVLSAVVLVFVIPKLEDLFGGIGNLPLPTRMMVTASNFILYKWYLLISISAAIVISFTSWKKSKMGSRQWGNFLLSLPVVGSINQKMILNRVTRLFSFLVGAGVPVIEGLKIVSHSAGNQMYQEKLLLAADDLSKGISIAENLADDEKLFPEMLVNMISIGEKTASLDTIMGKAASFYNEELHRKVDTLSKVMEPILLGFIACAAVFMILAIYLPILKMNDKMVG